jgi:hypothetical protein
MKKISTMQDAHYSVDGVKNGIAGPRKFSNQNILQRFIITEAKVYCRDKALAMRGMDLRMRN